MSVITSWGATPNRMRIALRLVSSSVEEGMTSGVMQQMLLPAALASSQSDDEPQGGSAIGVEVISELRNLGLLIEAGNGCLIASTGAVGVTDDQFVRLLQDKLVNPAGGRQPQSGVLPPSIGLVPLPGSCLTSLLGRQL